MGVGVGVGVGFGAGASPPQYVDHDPQEILLVQSPFPPLTQPGQF